MLNEAADNILIPGNLTEKEDHFLRECLRAFAKVFEMEFTGGVG